MDAKELETYEYQLSEVNATLKKDPSNVEMLTLRDELTNLISLTKEYLTAQAPSASASTSAAAASTSTAPAPVAGPSSKPKERIEKKAHQHQEIVTFNAGDQCMAKYSDGKYYPAKVTSVGGSSETRIYTVVFKGYDNTEVVSSSEIKPLSDSKKRALELSEQEAEKEKKRKKNEKKTETKAAKAAEQLEKQKSWQTFAKKGTKKGINIPGITGESMFASPDNPFGRVGVVGSGKGMTQYGSKQKHKFTGA